MDANRLKLIVDNKNALKVLDRYFKDSGELYLICEKLVKTRDAETRERLIKKLAGTNKAFSETITKMASIMATLLHNPQSPVVQ